MCTTKHVVISPSNLPVYMGETICDDVLKLWVWQSQKEWTCFPILFQYKNLYTFLVSLHMAVLLVMTFTKGLLHKLSCQDSPIGTTQHNSDNEFQSFLHKKVCLHASWTLPLVEKFRRACESSFNAPYSPLPAVHLKVCCCQRVVQMEANIWVPPLTFPYPNG